MKRTVPLLITTLVGFVLIGSAFIPIAESWGEDALIWFDILAGIAFILGGGNLLASQLRKISDRRAGWGYALVTLLSFCLMLAAGLFKIGSQPAPNQEFFGEVFVATPVENLPEFTIAATVPARVLEESLPLAVAHQVRLSANQIFTRGWLTSSQVEELKGLQQTLEWQCAVEQLGAAARPPQTFLGRLAYHADHRALGFKGVMSDAEQAELTASFPNLATAFEALGPATRRETTVPASPAPEGFALPGGLDGVVTVGSGEITTRGPMSTSQRGALSAGALISRRVLPPTPAGRAKILSDLGPFNEAQTQTAERLLTEDLAESLIAAVNTTGVSAPETKTACELLAERNAGVTDLVLTRPAPPPSTLNNAQEQILRDFLASESPDWASLSSRLKEAGPLTDAQDGALSAFRESLPTLGQRNRAMFDELIALGPLSATQREKLLKPFLDEYRWQESVTTLFFASHAVKYPWSGELIQQGSLFWWTYEYVFQPITSMMFALLAFYVASAAYRAFRAKNLEATLLLGTAFIILLGRTYAGVLLTGWLPKTSPFRLENLAVYLMNVFNSAGNRAIMIGIALGIASTSLKILLGIDRSHVGGKD